MITIRITLHMMMVMMMMNNTHVSKGTEGEMQFLILGFTEPLKI